ncbi:MAG: PilZ domain-containing protein [Acidimicrobiales bacterium]
MIDQATLKVLVHSTMTVFDADAASDGPTADAPVEGKVIGVTDRSQLELTTSDDRVLELDWHDVHAETGSGNGKFQVLATLEVTVHRPGTTVCLLTPHNAGEVRQTREWLRVRTSVPVRVTNLVGGSGGERVVDTVSVDLSGGGIRLLDGTGLKMGSTMTLLIDLPSGRVEVDCQTVSEGKDGSAGLRFLRRPEAVSQQIIRHVYDVQLAARRANRASV